MAQWGISRTFKTADVTVRLLPHVTTGDCFLHVAEPVRGIIDSIHLMDVQGEISAAGTVLADVQSRFVGKLYAEWFNG